MLKAVIVVPCFNEADRLPVERFVEFTSKRDDIAFLFVDDGSTDGTGDVIKALAGRNPRLFFSESLDRNQGKAEAVRHGILSAIRLSPGYVGFWDADLSTPLEEMDRFLDLYERMPDRVMVSGARVKLMGRSIERRAVRHYMGRIFSTVASLLLDIEMYDTQCGAKVFRCTPLTSSLFESEFHSKWLFDLELILRIRRQAATNSRDPLKTRIYEVPLNAWRDVSGSKITYSYFAWAVFDLLLLRLRYRG